MLSTLVAAAALCLAAPSEPPAPADAWTAREARHLMNRAGFGVPASELPALVALGRERLVSALMDRKPVETRLSERVHQTLRRGLLSPLAKAAPDERRHAYDRERDEYYVAMEEYERWWVATMLSGSDPLRDRMTLFWHGLIPTSKFTVREFSQIIDQHRMVRANALGSIRTILEEMARDPAMLRYLDNASNVKEHPNENWARELMELFSMGEGNYSEKDIREAARAFTGWTRENEAFLFREDQHDFGAKTVLGVTGRHDGGDVIDIILEHPATPRYLAGKMLAYLEGVEPGEERLAAYADHLVEVGFEVEPFLRTLFNDPEFYRDEVVGQRVAGPIDFLVGACRRLDLRGTEQVVLAGGVILGQFLFAPPSVKGWDGGLEWVNSSTIIQRGNLAGVLLGQVRAAALMADANEAKVAFKEAAGYRSIHDLQESGWEPAVALTPMVAATGVRSDAEVVQVLLDGLLAVDAEPGLVPPLMDALARARTARDLPAEGWLDDPERAEPVLRTVAHLVLSLPEAQLH